MELGKAYTAVALSALYTDLVMRTVIVSFSALADSGQGWGSKEWELRQRTKVAENLSHWPQCFTTGFAVEGQERYDNCSV